MNIIRKIGNLFTKDNRITSVKVPNRRLELYPENRELKLSYPETKKVSIFESEKPNRLIRVVDEFKKITGEKPPVDFEVLVNYKNKTPQIDTIIGFETDMIVGTDMNINADDEEAKILCEEMAEDIMLYQKIRNHTTTALTCGFGLLLRVAGKEGLANVEEYDITSITEAFRDPYGNPISYSQDIGNNQHETIKVTPNHIPLIFKRNGRSAFGLSEFHGLAVRRTVNNRTTRPLIEAMWSLDDVTIGTLENFAYPVEYHVYEGANPDDLELEARKLKDQKAGDRFVISRPHQIDRREPTQAKFDGYINHFKDLLQHGTGFPLDMLTGDFTSRASSETADTFFMRKIKSYQKYLVKLIKEDMMEYHLRLLGWSEDKIEKANVSVEFEIDTAAEYTPSDVLSRVNAGLWTKDEGREYDKGNGQDLFDDDKIIAADELKQQMDVEQHKNNLQKNFSQFKKSEALIQRAEEIKDKVFTENVKKAIKNRMELEIEEAKEKVEGKKLQKKVKEQLLDLLEDMTGEKHG